MKININNLEIYYAGYRQDVYGHLAFLHHENNQGNNCAGMEKLLINSKYYIIILWSGIILDAERTGIGKLLDNGWYEFT